MIQGSLISQMMVDDTGWIPQPPPAVRSRGIKRAVLDFETTGLKWWEDDAPVGFGLLTEAGYGYYPFAHRGGGNLSPDACLRWAREELRDVDLVTLNGKFEVHMGLNWGVDFEAQGCRVWDVSHYAALLDDHRRRFSLEELSQSNLGRGKVKGLDPARISEYPAGLVRAYAEEDVVLTDLLEKKLWPLIQAEDLTRVLDLESRVIYPVVEMERNGALIDVELLERWVIESEQKYLKLIGDIYRETGIRVSPNSAEDISRLYRKLGIDVESYTPTGKPSFTDAVLALANHPIVEKLRRARKLDDLRNDYLIKYLDTVDGNGILRYGLHQLRADDGGTVTGRFSSSSIGKEDLTKKKIGANIQQVMTAEKQRRAFGNDDFIIRALFIPRRGYRSCTSDAEQIEFRLFAHYLKDERLNQAYSDEPRTNFHRWAERVISEGGTQVEYKTVKNTNFCYVYGGGIKKIALTAGISLAEAERFKLVFDRTIPGVGRLINEAARAAETRGFVKTFLGRRSRFPTKERTYKALNSVLQGGAADYNKMKLDEIYQERKRLGLILRFTVHDEIYMDVPNDEVGREVAQILDRQSWDFRVPILWSTRTGANWAECK